MDPLRDLTDKIVAYDIKTVDELNKEIKKTCKQIDDMCDEGDREVRFLTGNYTPSDIIQEGK